MSTIRDYPWIRGRMSTVGYEPRIWCWVSTIRDYPWIRSRVGTVGYEPRIRGRMSTVGNDWCRAGFWTVGIRNVGANYSAHEQEREREQNDELNRAHETSSK